MNSKFSIQKLIFQKNKLITFIPGQFTLETSVSLMYHVKKHLVS